MCGATDCAGIFLQIWSCPMCHALVVHIKCAQQAEPQASLWDCPLPSCSPVLLEGWRFPIGRCPLEINCSQTLLCHQGASVQTIRRKWSAVLGCRWRRVEPPETADSTHTSPSLCSDIFRNSSFFIKGWIFRILIGNYKFFFHLQNPERNIGGFLQALINVWRESLNF